MAASTIDIAIPDQAGRRALVTGASDGIGLRIATRLAAAGAELVLPVRSAEKGERAAAAIRARVPGAAIALPRLDLASLASVEALGDALLADGRPLHLLVANAGVMTPPSRAETADGFELQLGTNHLGHMALVGRLLPLLRAGGARVVSQVSVAASRGGIRWDDLQWERDYDGFAAYRQSKVAVGLFALELERRSRRLGWGLTSALSHPGVAPTSLLAARPELGRAEDTRDVRAIRWLSARGILVGTPETAALPALRAATDVDAGGRLVSPRGPARVGGAPSRQRLYRPLRDEAGAARLWERSEALTGVRFPG